jgi:hypothetical protein
MCIARDSTQVYDKIEEGADVNFVFGVSTTQENLLSWLQEGRLSSMAPLTRKSIRTKVIVHTMHMPRCTCPVATSQSLPALHLS